MEKDLRSQVQEKDVPFYAFESAVARGRGRGARRDSMGRYSRDDGKHQKVVSELKELQRMANNELDKEKYDSLIHLVESM